MGKLLSKADILKADDMQFEEVEVPEWGGTVRVKAMTGSERDRWEKNVIERKKGGGTQTKDNVRANLVAATVIDASGKLEFSQADIKALGAKSAAALERVYEVAAKLSRIGPQDVEDMTGNSETTPSDDSLSSSPAS